MNSRAIIDSDYVFCILAERILNISIIMNVLEDRYIKEIMKYINYENTWSNVTM